MTTVTTIPVAAASRDPSSAPDSLHAQNLKNLEWPALCSLLSPFTLHASLNSLVPIRNSLLESCSLHSQTSDALRFLSDLSGPPPGLSAVEDIRNILEDAASGVVLKIADICSVRRTLAVVRKVVEGLCQGGRRRQHEECEVRELATLEILPLAQQICPGSFVLVTCDFQTEDIL